MSADASVFDVLRNISGGAKLGMLVCLIILIFMIVRVVSGAKKHTKTDNLKKEIKSYMQPSAETHHVYSGNISVTLNGIQYSRGNRSKYFDIAIGKTTYLAPFMVDEWFEGRNYSERECEKILSDISYYLTSHKIVKNVIILSDEEYDNLEEHED